ncbi:MAG: Mur ligase domain-containing protein, partial [bacterium]
MLLQELIDDINPIQIKGKIDIEIDKIIYDSRQAENNSLFICIEGFNVDGHSFIDKAIQSGAVAILIEKELDEYKDNITYIKVSDT